MRPNASCLQRAKHLEAVPICGWRQVPSLRVVTLEHQLVDEARGLRALEQRSNQLKLGPKLEQIM